jgi:hypothetical protein
MNITFMVVRILYQKYLIIFSCNCNLMLFSNSLRDFELHKENIKKLYKLYFKISLKRLNF